MADRKLRAFRETLVVRGLDVAAILTRRLSLPVARTIGRFWGFLAWYVLYPYRRLALRHIADAFPEWDRKKQRQTIKAMFTHLGITLMEVLWVPNLDDRRLAETTVLENAEPLKELIARGQGCVVFTAHCGNWEWAAWAVARLGPLWVMQRERDEERMNELAHSIRSQAGIHTLHRGGAAAARGMIAAIKKGGMIAFLIDQNTKAPSARVPFFGMPAPTPIGPAKLAIRTGAHAVTIFIERDAAGIQHIRIGNPRPTSPDEDPIALTAELTRAIEEQVRRVPEQWVWMHKRWRARPKYDVGTFGES